MAGEPKQAAFPKHSKEEMISLLKEVETVAVATSSGPKIRTRMMHFAFDEDFNIYLATMKGDPKVLQLAHNRWLSLVFYKAGKDWTGDREIEIIGTANILKSEEERQESFKHEASRSPIVKHLLETGNTKILEAIKVVPSIVKYRVVGEVIQGVPPMVLEFAERPEEALRFEVSKRKVKSWITAVRLPFLTAPLVSVVLGTVIALAHTGTIHVDLFLLTLAAALLLHAGTNIANDYFDHRSGNDEVNNEFVRPFSGGSRMIQLGLLTPLEVFTSSLIFFFLGSMIGLYLTWTRGLFILFLGLVGVFSGFFYTAPPVNIAKRGIGEFFVGLNFGLLVTVGAYYVQTQALSWEPAIASIPVSMLIAAVLYINEFPDYTADKRVGKNTAVVRLGREKAAVGYAAMIAITYASIALSVLARLITPFALLSLLTMPLAIKAAAYARKYHSSSFDLIPANASTIMCYIATGAALSASYVLDISGLNGVFPLAIMAAAFGLLILWLHKHMENQMKTFHGVKKLVS